VIVYRDPPYAALPRENLLSRVVGLGPEITVCEDLFYALLWCALEEDGVIDLMNKDYVKRIDDFFIEGVKIVKG